MHRAEQILEAVEAAIQASVPSHVKVYTHRRESLSEEQDELPGITVDFGPDQPLDDDGAGNMAFIDSLLRVEVTALTAVAEERDVRRDLLDLRSEIHVALMSDRTLGLAFVAGTRYAGAAEPELDVSGETLVASLTSSWDVHYRMNITDPN